MVSLVCGALLLLVFIHSTICGPVFVLTTPKEIHYDSNLLVSVAAFGVVPGQTEEVSLEYKAYKDSSKILNSTNLVFTSDTSKEWAVFFTWDHMQKIDETAVSLTMANKDRIVSQMLSFSYDFGYIFIQTDKPVYTPLQTVKFRVIAVDEYQRLAKYIIRIDIKNPNSIVVDRMKVSAEEAFTAKEFLLPKDTPPGEWTITASFEGVDQKLSSMQSVTFEVKEYVLPRFSSIVTVDPDVITEGLHWITVTVLSKYVYGRPVIGTVNLRLGIWNDDTNITMLEGNYTRQINQTGHVQEYIKVDKLFPPNMSFRKNNRLYVRATVTEAASMESYTYEDTSTFISHPYYKVDFNLSKKYFKPGFPYTLQAQVTAQNGRQAAWVKLYVLPSFFNQQMKRFAGTGEYYKLNEFGELKFDFDVPPETQLISFLAIVADLKAPSIENFTLNVTKFSSPINQYLHINLTIPIKKNRNGSVVLRYTKPDPSIESSASENIIVLVLAKGHIIYTTTTTRKATGFSIVSLPFRLYAEISPSMRIIAYYSVMTDELDFVGDSLFVDTPDACLEEIQLISDGSSLHKPKDNFSMNVIGSSNMTVGFVAVDKAVFLLSTKPTLNRHLLFQLLGSHDKGVAAADGSAMNDVIMNSGLHHLVLNTNIPKVSKVPKVPAGMKTEWVKGRVFGEMTFNPWIKIVESHEQYTPFDRTQPPPQSVRNYFPETWFFEENKLPKNGRLSLDLKLPDSITTWSFMAVGISATRGVCVSHPLEQQVSKLFFVDVRLPYKATRLEEVKVKISVYNYQKRSTQVNGLVTGLDGLCFSANSARGSSQNSVSFTMDIPAGEAKGITVKVIPLKIGDLTLRVDVEDKYEKDIVEKNLYVVAEGQRVKKSITFVLDPESKHATFVPSKRQYKSLINSTTISNSFDLKNKEQHTTIDLSLPSNVIRGTESCRISAFGDLMGDIISHVVVDSNTLLENPIMNAEGVLSDLAPTVYALLSAQKFELLDDHLNKKAQKFIKSKLISLSSKMNEKSYFTSSKDKPSLWLTTFALKTLCNVNHLTFIDRKNLADNVIAWLAKHLPENGGLSEQDRRIQNIVPSEYHFMLNAEVLIAIKECGDAKMIFHSNIEERLSRYLTGVTKSIRDPLVVAKVAYALMLINPTSMEFHDFVNQLQIMRRKTTQGHFYWSATQEANEHRDKSIWHSMPIHASAIEATAYALMVFLKHRGINVDAIADWLVGQRNSNGGFVGAMDSSAAIQALSKYSLEKHGQDVDLHCNVSSDREKRLDYMFKFTKENAIQREQLTNVPVGKVLDVLTKGQGLGQMQVNVEYNVPIDKNQKCSFNISVNVSRTIIRWSENMDSNPLCASCDIGCKKTEVNYMTVLSDTLLTSQPSSVIRISKPKTGGGEKKKKKQGDKNKNKKTGNKNTSNRRTSRRPNQEEVKQRRVRAIDYSQSASSKKSICIHVCLKHLKQGMSQPIELRIEMLTGYRPVQDDINRIKVMSDVEHVEYDEIQEVLKVQFLRISCTEQTCVAFRAVDEGETGRMMPANVEIIPIGKSEPQCVVEYEGLPDDQSLQVYCADFAHSNKGECRCYSGLCSKCLPSGPSDLNGLGLIEIKKLVCQKPIVYQLQIANVTNMDRWVEINSRIVSLNKTGTDNISPGSVIKMMSPNSCSCPVYHYKNTADKFYMLSQDVEKMVDRNDEFVYRYLLDEHTLILRVSEPGTPPTTSTLPHYFLQNALDTNLNRCN